MVNQTNGLQSCTGSSFHPILLPYFHYMCFWYVKVIMLYGLWAEVALVCTDRKGVAVLVGVLVTCYGRRALQPYTVQ